MVQGQNIYIPTVSVVTGNDLGLRSFVWFVEKVDSMTSKMMTTATTMMMMMMTNIKIELVKTRMSIIAIIWKITMKPTREMSEMRKGGVLL